MDSGNAIIIALIAIIIVAVGLFFFVNSNGIAFGDDNQADDSSLQVNNTPVSSDLSSDSQSGAGSSSSSGSTPTETVSSSDSSSSSDDSSSDTSSSDASSSSSDSTPQAGQSEDTYDPTDFD